MKIAIAPAPLLAALAVVIGGTGGLALSLISRPADADPRMAKVRDTMAQVERLKSQPGTAGNLPVGSVCAADPAKAADTFKMQWARAAGRHKIPVTNLAVTPANDPSQGQLTPLAVAWKGSGEYSDFVAVLAELTVEKPVLFVEALDIKPRGSRAEFELKGKIWCWTPVANRS